MDDMTQAYWDAVDAALHLQQEQEQQQMTTELGAIAKALAAAQAEMSNPSFDSQNPHFKSRFASLASVRNAVVPVLAVYRTCAARSGLAVRIAVIAIAPSSLTSHAFSEGAPGRRQVDRRGGWG